MATTVRALAAQFGSFCGFAGPRARHVVLAAAAFSLLAAAATAFSLSGSDADVATEGGARTACAEQTWPYIEPRCLKGGNREVRHVMPAAASAGPPELPASQAPAMQKPTARRAASAYTDEIDAAPARPRRARTDRAADWPTETRRPRRESHFFFFPQGQRW